MLVSASQPHGPASVRVWRGQGERRDLIGLSWSFMCPVSAGKIIQIMCPVSGVGLNFNKRAGFEMLCFGFLCLDTVMKAVEHKTQKQFASDFVMLSILWRLLF